MGNQNIDSAKEKSKNFIIKYFVNIGKSAISIEKRFIMEI